MPMSRVIETERLVLRPWAPSDADAALAVFATPAARRWLWSRADAPASVDEMRARIARWQPDDHAHTEVLGHWAVCDRASSGVLGGVSLEHAALTESLALGVVLAPSAWRHGYAAEAGDALVRWAMHEEGATEVFALVPPDNVRAAATAERIGMEWVTELGHVGNGRYRVYRIRHGDLDVED